jgi:hypothetical protein
MSRRSKPVLGSGDRFNHLAHELAQRNGVTDPKALAAWIGRKKYGAKRMANWAAKGRSK